jgi:DNA-binding transcriptional MocR family regulator
MSGWIVLARGWRDDEVFDECGPLSEREAWVWLLEKAAWKKCHRRNAKGERITVERGQFHTSLRNLSTAFGWGKNKVARYLDKLADYGLIGTVAGQSGCMITICNYSKYQDQRDSPSAENGTVAGQSRDTQEQRKQDIPFSKEKGAVDLEAKFWADCKAVIGGKNPGALLNKWLREHGKAATRHAITAAQIERAVDPIPYIERVLRGAKQRNEISLC